MTKLLKLLAMHPIIFVLIFVLVVYLPTSVSLPPEGVHRQHVASIGVDLAPEGVEVCVLSHVSKQSNSFAETYILTSATAPTIADALHEITSITGRMVILTHATTIVVSQEVASAGLHNYLDYFYRDNNVSNDIFVCCTINTPAKTLLMFEKERINSTGHGLEELLVYNTKNTYFFDSDVESFYKGYFSPTHISVLGAVQLEENPDAQQLLSSGGSSSGGESSGGSGSSGSGGSSQQSTQKNMRIKSTHHCAVLRRGYLVNLWQENELMGMNLATQNAKGLHFVVNNFSDELFQNVNIHFDITKNNVQYKSFFENNRPVFEIHSLLTLDIESVICQEAIKEYYLNNINPLSFALKTEISKVIKQKFSNFLQKSIQNKADVLGVFTTFNNQCGKNFMQWYEALDDPQDFLSNIEFRMTVDAILTT